MLIIIPAEARWDYGKGRVSEDSSGGRRMLRIQL